ncbi:MAG: PTS sugar transporter subunit IIB [Eubacteriaceae bacterium]|nr:PTS sugar transporter subunit IIB [Eubacteriaceae bacterium]
MAKVVKILVCCGTGIATSTVANDAIQKMCKRNNIDCNIVQGKVTEIPSKLEGFKPDVIISTTQVACNTKGVPVLSGLPILMGRGMDKLEADFLKAINFEG